MAANIDEFSRENPHLEKIMIFSHSPVLEVASKLFNNKEHKHVEGPLIADLQGEEWAKARCLFGDIDLEAENPYLQKAIQGLHLEWNHEPASRDCFIEN